MDVTKSGFGFKAERKVQHKTRMLSGFAGPFRVVFRFPAVYARLLATGDARNRRTWDLELQSGSKRQVAHPAGAEV